MQHRLKENLRVIGSSIQLRSPIKYKKAMPMLGEHRDEILSRGVDAEQWVEL